jgi:methionine-rich copper-binding protein CopC
MFAPHPSRAWAAPGLALIALLGTAVSAAAHAQYGDSNPEANGTVSSLPSTLDVSYTQALASIQIAVTGPDGSNVTTGPATFDLNERHHASVPIRSAGPGLYTVVWHNVSGDDGDPNDGSFVFTVAAPAPTPQPAGTPAPAQPAATSAAPAAAAASPTPVPTISPDDVVNPHMDVRINTYRKRQAIRDQYQGQIDVAVFNAALADGEGLESALKDAMAAKSGSADQGVLDS